MMPRLAGLLPPVLTLVPYLAAQGQASVSAVARGSILTHRVEDGVRSQSMGFVSGAALELRLASGADFTVSALAGSLDGSGQPSDERDLTQVSAEAGVRVASWLELDAGVAGRSYRMAQGREQWTIGSLGAEARLPFMGAAAHGVFRAALLPLVSVAGLPTPTVAFETSAGVQYRLGPLAATLRYELERVDFPARTSPRRLEQLSGVALDVRIGLRGVNH